MKILLCASSRRLSDTFFKMATDLGAHIGKSKYDLIYGGGDVGLMGEVARAAALSGAQVTGYVPTAFHKVAPDQPHMNVQTHIVETLFERKEKMLFSSQLLLVLPGGLGTLDEKAEGAAANDIQCYIDDTQSLKPIIIMNLPDQSGVPYFRGFKLLLEDMVRNGAMDAERMAMFHFPETTQETIFLLDFYAQQGFPSVASLKRGWNPQPG